MSRVGSKSFQRHEQKKHQAALSRSCCGWFSVKVWRRCRWKSLFCFAQRPSQAKPSLNFWQNMKLPTQVLSVNQTLLLHYVYKKGISIKAADFEFSFENKDLVRFTPVERTTCHQMGSFSGFLKILRSRCPTRRAAVRCPFLKQLWTSAACTRGCGLKSCDAFSQSSNKYIL